ncbi:MAG: ABC transporter substrate-binding protein, partial [Humibacter sp.]
MKPRALLGRVVSIGVVAIAAGALIAGCTSTSAPSAGDTSTSGGEATFAWAPGSTPNYILPFIDAAHRSVYNLYQFQQLMYRPLYPLGFDGKAQVDENLALADAPQFSSDDKTVTINLKDYKWSDGTAVSASDVMFFVNMAIAEKSQWGMYSAGGFPDNVASTTVDSPTQLTFHLTEAFSPTWYLNNQLYLIVPMPAAWDKTSDSAAAGSGGCATSVAKCAAVFSYLSSKTKDMSSYASDPLWKVVDGPWTLQSFNSDGHVSFVPNKKYSGPVRPKLDKVSMLPYTSTTAEYSALESGS